jgi:hypothetical protein
MEWISVKDRLPAEEQLCLCFDDWHKQIRCLTFSYFHNCWDDEDGDDYYTDAIGGKVTFWMPLPEPPKS